jgi:hypothetical protein
MLHLVDGFTIACRFVAELSLGSVLGYGICLAPRLQYPDIENVRCFNFLLISCFEC